MAARHHYIQIVEGADGEMICIPTQTLVDAGDAVQWRGVEGDIVVQFESDTPFTLTQNWTAGAGFLTGPAIVRPGLSPQSPFVPVISMNGTQGTMTIGKIIPSGD
jgi:hypothetical protein